MKKILIFFTVFICTTNFEVIAQDSLYLVGTITGESIDKRLTNVDGIGDVNSDGYDDFIVTSLHFEKKAKLYFGAANMDLNEDLTLIYPGTDTLIHFWGKSFGIGDVNGDNFNDFAIQGGFEDLGFLKGKVFLYLGGDTINITPVNELYEPWNQDGFGAIVVGVKDINKDGYNDFAIGSPYNWTTGSGYVYLFWGGDTISFERSLTFTTPVANSGDFFGKSVANIGDVNDDGFDDIAIGAPEELSGDDSGHVYIYLGGEQMDNVADIILVSNGSGVDFGGSIKNAGDLNKDGITDFCITEYPYIFIYDNYFSNPLKVNGYSLDAGGDINNDGYDDLIIGNDFKINVYLGSENFEPINPLIIVDDGIYFTGNISIGGDINNDGYDDIFALAPNYPSVSEPQGKLFIYSYKFLTDVKDDIKNTPNNFQLFQNYPNPFNPSTKIKYAVPIVADALNASTTNILLKVYDVLGNEIATLVDEQKLPGIYEVEFNGSGVASGIYFYQLKVSNPSQKSGQDFTETKKFILMK